MRVGYVGLLARLNRAEYERNKKALVALAPEQNHCMDHYLDVLIDLSKVCSGLLLQGLPARVGPGATRKE
jgi:hypothetical protein